MSIEHKDITDPNRHEPKGISTALVNTSYVANGSGSGAWSKIPVQGLNGVVSNGVSGQAISVDGTGLFGLKWTSFKGYIYYVNIASPTTITFPSVYTKVNVVTTASGGAIETTEGTNSRITYTGSTNRRAIIQASVNLSQSIGADRDVRIVLYKNGSIASQSEVVVTTKTATKTIISTIIETGIVTNDYFEVYIRNDGASGDIAVYGLTLLMTGF